ncbi:MAG: guanine deaminase [Deltaproteobacteria bacterium CG_4_10_14_0_2_um_filter_43_8]|nr:MAG: guanine deaminase [Deltaproteobacteria bacterium CG11_big_fil_rev_8_21_14_0_20_42_23]PJA21130.1 MAG: guanine deaminase [Deltaproteobacteria bacterium CG_4_10_14_0_2_um_filter_43_8]PJC63547.1 MAG: guanine deaminase [Deltaproteobacteria bacterium CG_4_9_14_0_2_um_filter_42_21]
MVKMKQQAYRARILSPVSTSETKDFLDGVLLVEDGKIISCQPYQDTLYSALPITDFKGLLIIPGLVDLHSHIPQLDCRGKYGVTLLDWLDRYIFPAEKSFSDLNVVDQIATRFFKKLILNGTTTSLLYSTIHEAATHRCFEIAQASGLRAIIGKVMMDQHSPEGLLEKTKNSLAASERLCSFWHGKEDGRLHYAFTPRFAPTCSETLWREISSLVKSSGAYLQTHIAETLGENKRVQELFPQFKDYFSLFEETGCACEKTVFAHAIHLSDNEYNRLGKSKSAIAHCPTSNLFLKSGTMPIKKVEDAGIHFGFGTDLGAGLSLSLFQEMRHADYSQREIDVLPTKAFYLATLGGARALNLEDHIGSLEQGKKADFCVVDISHVEPAFKLNKLDTNEILSLLMYRGNGRAIQKTFVNGNELKVDFI